METNFRRDRVVVIAFNKMEYLVLIHLLAHRMIICQRAVGTGR